MSGACHTQCVCVCVSVPGHVDSAAEEYLRVYNVLDKLADLTRSTVKDPAALSELEHLQQILRGDGDVSSYQLYSPSSDL